MSASEEFDMPRIDAREGLATVLDGNDCPEPLSELSADEEIKEGMVS
jgi:hypothetical protein